MTQTGTQTSPDGNAKGHFSIGSNGKDESLRLSPKISRKERTSRQLRSKRDRSHSPNMHHSDRHSKEKSSSTKDTVKEAMSPSVAECLRAVFAAFLWHEGIVYDAMACASFLKFNPNMPKDSVKQTQQPVMREKTESTLTREQKARLRHSVEVAPGFLTLQPSPLDQMLYTPLNANIMKNKKNMSIWEEQGREGHSPKPSIDGENAPPREERKLPMPEFEKSDLPQSLQYLVYLWELISKSFLKVIVQQLVFPSPITGSKVFHKLEKDRTERDKDRRLKKRKDYRQAVVSRSHLFGEASGAAAGADKETMCELCGQFYPHPVTYHMRQAHPGCSDHAGGKGYNSGGNFCGGWAGNCGEGGIGGSSWYLICDRCREKYLRQKRQNLIREKAKKSHKKSNPARLLSPMPPLEVHQVMKNNALFLLELSSATQSGVTSKPNVAVRRSLIGCMPSLLEQGDSLLENNPFPMGPLQCLESLGVQQQYNTMLGQEFLSEEEIWALQNDGVMSLVSSYEPSASHMSSSGGIMRSQTLNGDGAEPSSPGASGSNTKHEIRRRSGREGRENGVAGSAGTRTFHRSISVGLTSKEWNKHDGEGLLEGRVVMMRKRNSSGSDGEETHAFGS